MWSCGPGGSSGPVLAGGCGYSSYWTIKWYVTKAWWPPSKCCQFSVHCLGDTNTLGCFGCGGYGGHNESAGLMGLLGLVGLLHWFVRVGQEIKMSH